MRLLQFCAVKLRAVKKAEETISIFEVKKVARFIFRWILKFIHDYW